MIQEANDEIENFAPELKTSSAVLGVRLEIYRISAKWELMEVVARELWQQHQEQPIYWNNLEFAVRRSSELEDPHTILSEELKKNSPLRCFKL